MQIIPNRAIRLTHEVRRAFAVTVPKGMTVEDILKPEAWQYAALDLHVGTLIEVMAEDGSFDGLLRVIERGQHGVTVRIIHMAIYGEQAERPADASALAQAAVGWGGKHKWRITLPNGTIVSKDHASEEIAQAELARLRGEPLTEV
jgi:hypothetical protein